MKNRDARRYGRGSTAPGWHYLAGSEDAIARIASAAGFHFSFDSRTRLYAHPSGFVVLTSTGVISQYFLGIDFDAKAVAVAIDRAAQGKTGSSVFELLLLCARGAGAGGRYSGVVWLALDLGVVLTIGLLGWGISAMVRGAGVSPMDGASRRDHRRDADDTTRARCPWHGESDRPDLGENQP